MRRYSFHLGVILLSAGLVVPTHSFAQDVIDCDEVQDLRGLDALARFVACLFRDCPTREEIEKACAVAPPPPPPPPAPVCETGPYIVFFNVEDDAIAPEVSSILDNSLSAYANCGTARVRLSGHVDGGEELAGQSYLGAERSEAVRDYLVSRGLPEERILSENFEFSRPRVPTAPGVYEMQNRRVVVTFGPGNEM
jgi:outer membrane protein OmpA-like peptidoglycan-associated protein